MAIEPDPGQFPFVNDPDRGLYLGSVPTGAPFTDSFTFDAPGRYLVICNIARISEEAQMWGWVNVNQTSAAAHSRNGPPSPGVRSLDV